MHKPVCVLFVSSRSGIVFNPSVGAITDHSQSAKDIDPYFRSLFCVEDHGHRKPVVILPNGLSKPGERAHGRNLISAVGEIRTHTLLIDSPACYPLSYHSPITAINGFGIILSTRCYYAYLNFSAINFATCNVL